MKDTHKLKNILIWSTAAGLMFSGLIACSENSSRLITEEPSQQSVTSAPISMIYTARKGLVVGQALDVTVEFKTLADAEALKLEITEGKGLELQSGKYDMEYGNQPKNSSFSETVSVIPQTEGRLYLNIFITGTFSGYKMIKTAAIPIQVGSDTQITLESPGQVMMDSNGKKIIVIPLEEKKVPE